MMIDVIVKRVYKTRKEDQDVPLILQKKEEKKF